jgi:hypothetical protein
LEVRVGVRVRVRVRVGVRVGVRVRVRVEWNFSSIPPRWLFVPKLWPSGEVDRWSSKKSKSAFPRPKVGK